MCVCVCVCVSQFDIGCCCNTQYYSISMIYIGPPAIVGPPPRVLGPPRTHFSRVLGIHLGKWGP